MEESYSVWLTPYTKMGEASLGGAEMIAFLAPPWMCLLAVSPEVSEVSGKYFKYCRPLGSSRESNDPDVQRRLWEVSESLTGYTFPA